MRAIPAQKANHGRGRQESVIPSLSVLWMIRKTSAPGSAEPQLRNFGMSCLKLRGTTFPKGNRREEYLGSNLGLERQDAAPSGALADSEV
jgi:hypothetical protein